METLVTIVNFLILGLMIGIPILLFLILNKLNIKPAHLFLLSFDRLNFVKRNNVFFFLVVKLF